MNTRKYVFLLVVNIVILHSTVVGSSNRAFSHRRRFGGHHTNHTKNWPIKWKEDSDQFKDEDGQESKEPLADISEQESIDETEEESFDLGKDGNQESGDEAVAPAEGVVPKSKLKRHPHPNIPPAKQQPLQMFSRQEMADGGEEIQDQVDEGNLDDGEDYARQISYNPNIPVVIRNKERSKRLIMNNKEDENENLDEDSGKDYEKSESLENDDDIYKELLLDENPPDFSTKSQEFRESRKIAENHSVSSLGTTSASNRNPTDNEAHVSSTLISKISPEPNDRLFSKVLKKSNPISDPKSSANSLNTKLIQNNGTSQGFKNVVELNKAYKLLLCACNKFVKLANKTLMDKMSEECATVSTTSPTKMTTGGTTGITTGISTGETVNGSGDCCNGNAKCAAAFRATSQKPAEADAAETEDSFVEDLLDITVKSKKKQGIRPNKELFSWIQSHDNVAYDSFPGMHILPERVDPNVYVYGDYDNADTADDYDDQVIITESVKKSSMMSVSMDIMKGSTRSFDASSSAKSAVTSSKKEDDEGKQIVSKTISATKVKTPSTIRMTTPLSQGSSSASSVGTPGEQVQSPADGVRSKQRNATPRNHIPRRFKQMNMRKMRYNKKFLPISLLRTVCPMSLRDESAISESNSTHGIKEAGLAPQVVNVYEELNNME